MEKKIYTKMIEVMSAASSIGKNKKNTMQNYMFRGIDDVYNDLHDILAKCGVFTTSDILDDRTEERQTKNGGLLIYRVLKIKYTFWADDGSSVDTIVIGEGMDSGDKASNKGMAVAHKYALLQAFCIPTEDKKDPENESPEPLPQIPQQPKQPRKSAIEWNKETDSHLAAGKIDSLEKWEKWIDYVKNHQAPLGSVKYAETMRDGWKNKQAEEELNEGFMAGMEEK